MKERKSKSGGRCASASLCKQNCMHMCLCLCAWLPGIGISMWRDNSYPSITKRLVANQLRERSEVGERIVFGLMLIVLICNFSSVWAQRKSKPIRKQRQTTFQADNAVLIYSSLPSRLSLSFTHFLAINCKSLPSLSHCWNNETKMTEQVFQFFLPLFLCFVL